MFPSLSADVARDILRRCQEELLVGIATSNLPAFTVSFGVVDTSSTTELARLVTLADDALFHSKRAGRDRIVVAGAPTQAAVPADRPAPRSQ